MNQFTPAALALYLICNSAPVFSSPCLEKIQPLPFIGISVFEDCDNDQILYFLPENLNLKEGLFSGKKSFRFYEKKDGSAIVKIALKLLTDSSTVLRVIRSLKRDHKQQYRIKPFRIKDVKLTGFSSDEGVISQKITAMGQFSDSTFAIQLKLNPEGVELWKESAEMGSLEVEPAMLTYKFQAVSDGELQWREMSYSINVESLPACAILGEDCTDHVNDRLAIHGQLFGQLYFHEQYVQCRDLVEKSFEKPSRAEISDNNLDRAERQTVYLFAKEAFDEEYEAQKRDCADELNCFQGQRWFKDFSSGQNICDLSWRDIQAYLGYRSQKYVECAKAEYDIFLEKHCEGVGIWDCDERKGDSRCRGTLKGTSQVCFDTEIIKNQVRFKSGSCDFAVFLRHPVFQVYILDKFVETSVADARRVPTCIKISKSVDSISAVRARIQCKQ